MHTPNKTLFYMIDVGLNKNELLKTKKDYINYYCNNDFSINLSDKTFKFKDNVIYNDYEKFAQKVVYSVLSL